MTSQAKDVDTINALRMFPDLKPGQVTEKHRAVARMALAHQIVNRKRPPVPHTALATAVRTALKGFT